MRNSLLQLALTPQLRPLLLRVEQYVRRYASDADVTSLLLTFGDGDQEVACATPSDDAARWMRAGLLALECVTGIPVDFADATISLRTLLFEQYDKLVPASNPDLDNHLHIVVYVALCDGSNIDDVGRLIAQIPPELSARLHLHFVALSPNVCFDIEGDGDGGDGLQRLVAFKRDNPALVQRIMFISNYDENARSIGHGGHSLAVALGRLAVAMSLDYSYLSHSYVEAAPVALIGVNAVEVDKYGIINRQHYRRLLNELQRIFSGAADRDKVAAAADAAFSRLAAASADVASAAAADDGEKAAEAEKAADEAVGTLLYEPAITLLEKQKAIEALASTLDEEQIKQRRADSDSQALQLAEAVGAVAAKRKPVKWYHWCKARRRLLRWNACLDQRLAAYADRQAALSGETAKIAAAEKILAASPIAVRLRALNDDICHLTQLYADQWLPTLRQLCRTDAADAADGYPELEHVLLDALHRRENVEAAFADFQRSELAQANRAFSASAYDDGLDQRRMQRIAAATLLSAQADTAPDQVKYPIYVRQQHFSSLDLGGGRNHYLVDYANPRLVILLKRGEVHPVSITPISLSTP